MFKTNPSFSIRGEKFNVIILAAGFGSKAKPGADRIPKALIEISDGFRAIDHLIQKYQYIADRIIIAVGFGADLIENYIKGKYPRLNIYFSREKEGELKSPGRSLVFALDHASSNNPTIVTFCDYLLSDYINVESDALCICSPKKGDYVLDIYRNKSVIKNGFVVDLIRNKNLKDAKEGFTGLGIFHNTLLLKAITYGMASKKTHDTVDYTSDIVKTYVSKVKTLALPIHQQYEFGSPENLERVKELFKWR